MAKLKLTVPRRHILAALKATSRHDAQPVLQHVCFQPHDEHGVRTIATTGQYLVYMDGGIAEGDWPDTGEVLVHFSKLPTKRAKGLLDKAPVVIGVEPVKGGHKLTVTDGRGDFSATDTAGTSRYPNWPEAIKGFRNGKFKVARDPVPMDATKLLTLVEMASLFGAPAKNHNTSFEFRVRRGGKNTDPMPVAIMTAAVPHDWWPDNKPLSRRMWGVLMGLRTRSA